MSEVTPNKDRLRLWVERLESGQDKQVRAVMGNGYGYCCLGVLNEVAIENGVPLRRTTVKNTNIKGTTNIIAYDHETGSYIPDRAADWFGVDPLSMSIYANQNDRGETFKQIAATVREDFNL